MKKSSVHLMVSMIVCSATLFLHASDIHLRTFTDFDKKLFTNDKTKQVELVYSTALIESISQEPVQIERWTLEQILYPALTRAVFKKQELHDAVWEKLLQPPKEQCKDNCNYEEKIDAAYATLKRIQHLIPNNTPYIYLSTRDLMLAVQYAAHKIERLSATEITLFVGNNENQKVRAYGQFGMLLNTYSAYEQSY